MKSPTEIHPTRHSHFISPGCLSRGDTLSSCTDRSLPQLSPLATVQFPRHSAGFRWKSGQSGSSNNNARTNNTKKDKENRLQKLSAGKMKIRMLKDEPLTAPPQPPPLPPASVLQRTRKNRLRGTVCGQCEVKTAGLKCAECTENYCIACFVRFHQKGALKLHRTIPIKTELQTLVSTQDVLSNDPNAFTSPNINTKTSPSHSSMFNADQTRPGEQSPEKGGAAMATPMQLHPDPNQVLVVNHSEESNFGFEPKSKAEKGFPTCLLGGEYDEEESARSFQEALRQWRGETNDEAGDRMEENEVAMWIPVRPVLVSAIATQADLTADREVEGRGCGEGQGRIPVRVEFTPNSLTYTDRLLLKKHRRTPIETYVPSSTLAADSKSRPELDTEEEVGLTAQEEDFRLYYASLFAVPVSRGKAQAQITTPESCLVIDVQDETDTDVNGDCAEQRMNSNREVALSEQGRTLVPQMTLTSEGPSRASLSSPRPPQLSTPTQPKPTHKHRLSKAETSKAKHSMKSSPSQTMPPLCPTVETPRTSRTSIRTPALNSQKAMCYSTVHKSSADHGSSQPLSSSPNSQDEILKSSRSHFSFTPDESLHLNPTPPPPPLRSTFTVSPSSSAESPSLPRVNRSTPLHQSSDSYLSSNIFPRPVSSLKLSQSPPSNLDSPKQSQRSLFEPESLLSDDQLQLPQSDRPDPQPKSLELNHSQTNPVPFSATVKTPSSLSLFNESLPDANLRYKSIPPYGDTMGIVLMSASFISGSHKSTLSRQVTECVSSLSSRPLNVNQNISLAVKMEKEEAPSVDSGDEMSSDSLVLAPHVDEAETHGHLTRGRSREEEQQHSATSHCRDSFVHTDDEIVKGLLTDEPEQLSETSMVMSYWSAGSASEESCDVSLDLSRGHSDTTENTQCDPLQTHQPSTNESDPPDSYGPHSRLRASTERHLVFKMMDNHMQPSEIQMRSATTSSRGEISANELGTSGSKWSGRSTPTVSHPATTNPSPLPETMFPLRSARSSRPTLGSDLGPAFHPVSRAAQEIMEICSVDQTGCEDPDLDSDTAAHHLHSLEQELKIMTKETGTQASSSAAVNSRSQVLHGNQPLTRVRVTKEQKEEEEAVQRDRRSVLSLP
uniref:cell wall protein RBR3 isoform X2 n=1 Tax=Solea senegalensis TaxID=28829 RepID=UPI001CD8665B|nr:cell wall protein RBR3 isoform X2 [Solea senegalensis]